MRTLIGVMVILSLTACGGSSSATGNGAGPNGTATTAGPRDTTTVAGTGAFAAGSVEAAGADALHRGLNIPVEKLQLVSKTARNWPDSALGCRAEGMMYSQIITPGYLLVYTDGTAQHEVHTNQTGQSAVVCRDGKPVIGK